MVHKTKKINTLNNCAPQCSASGMGKTEESTKLKHLGKTSKKINGKQNDIAHFSVRPPYPKDIVT